MWFSVSLVGTLMSEGILEGNDKLCEWDVANTNAKWSQGIFVKLCRIYTKKLVRVSTILSDSCTVNIFKILEEFNMLFKGE